MAFKGKKPTQRQQDPNAPVVKSVVVTGVGVRVAFDRKYADDLEADLKPSAEVVFNRIADATGSCQVHRCTTTTVELMGQQGNSRVNTFEAMCRTAGGFEPEQTGPTRMRGHGLRVVRWTLWSGRADQVAQVFSANLPEAQELTVVLYLAIAGGFTASHLEKLRRAAAKLPGGQLMTTEPASEALVQYVTSERSDVALPSEIMARVDELGKRL